MKNSGLGLLQESLMNCDVFFGKNSGFRENEFLKEYHEGILEYNGGSWNNPPFKVKLNHYQRQLIGLFTSYFSEQSSWGFRDFRTLFLLKEWEDVISNTNPIGIFCHPSQMVDNYKEHFNFPARLSMELYIKYHRKLLTRFDNQAFPVIELTESQSDFTNHFQLACQQIGLDYKPISSKLNYGGMSFHESRELSKEVMKVYRRLSEIKIQS